ncbi:hypothetical protein Marme_0554 [Marinomonas mediterranea MMB-1]|uniref:Uncharacterized protein n=1 Tax=Marinomonas mediterranea (strain ATCC 700492 / JCM 21426 / NBRC 103028 / MMB-1) TaxID=717774 RepID=F2K0D5_MARM1|nr:hypothetical protein Marme_0554 [Marinomonas mediterranea MMB-1]
MRCNTLVVGAYAEGCDSKGINGFEDSSVRPAGVAYL